MFQFKNARNKAGATMNEFKQEIMDCVNILRAKYKKSKTCVIADYPVIEIVRFLDRKEISEKLTYDPATGTFTIEAPDAQYYSTISHYDFRRAERRWTRNKDLLFALIKDLKYCGLWDHVANKNFLTINSHNENIDPKKLKTDLKKIMSKSTP